MDVPVISALKCGQIKQSIVKKYMVGNVDIDQMTSFGTVLVSKSR